MIIKYYVPEIIHLSSFFSLDTMRERGGGNILLTESK